MQKLISKYGLAAHLALLAVAPLFLFPFCADGTVVKILVWLSLPAALWTLLEPAKLGGERLHKARSRVVKAILRDPLFWASLVLVLLAGIRALNTGIALGYDAESSVWCMSAPSFPILPGVVGASGDLPFAAMLACAVLLQAGRHSLGAVSRMAFFQLTSCLSGLAALIALGAVYEGHSVAVALLPSPGGTVFSFVGFAYGLYLLGGIMALGGVVEGRWRSGFPLLLAIGGTSAGVFAFAPPYLAAAFGAAGVLLMVYVLAFSWSAFSGSGGLKLLMTVGAAFAFGGLIVAAILPKDVVEARLAAFASLGFFPERFWDTRSLLSSVALKSWISHLWIGTGIDSFPFDFRFSAKDADWMVLPRGVASLPNGWWLLLAERGIVGIVCFALPFAFLLFTYCRRLADGVFRARAMPHPACLLALLALILFVTAGFLDCSPLRSEVLMAMCAFLAVSAAMFQSAGGDQDG